MLVYIYEPSLIQNDHYSDRHWRFVAESIEDLNNTLNPFGTHIHCFEDEVLPVFSKLLEQFTVRTVFSTEESGLDITYRRDIAFAQFCDKNGIDWQEFQNGGVQRGIRNRDEWRDGWYGYMNKTIKIIDFNQATFADSRTLSGYTTNILPDGSIPETHVMQKGGRTEGKEWEESFFSERIEYYSQYISKPEMSRYGCSRLSPYIAWGCISVRELFQRVQELRKESTFKKQLSAFSSRLRWQAHFIQKFEMEPRIEFEPFNKGYLRLQQPINQEFVSAWKEGRTGYPLVDAAIRAVKETGYLNFRMRTMTTSFLLHHLFQNFRTGSAWLARQFLDFEPGIHYGQFQMQAGLTATNTIRIYNPTKNAHDHDSEAVFIKKYVPELAHLPIPLAIEPWNITEMEEVMYNFKIGINYPKRIVDTKETRAKALKELYGLRKLEETQAEKQRILDVHTLKRRFP